MLWPVEPNRGGPLRVGCVMAETVCRQERRKLHQLPG
ncbi:MAG: hypothetical protein K0R85_2431 [Devosia sp.]|nr:hypothetical protein [Devosia sp.]